MEPWVHALQPGSWHPFPVWVIVWGARPYVVGLVQLLQSPAQKNVQALHPGSAAEASTVAAAEASASAVMAWRMIDFQVKCEAVADRACWWGRGTARATAGPRPPSCARFHTTPPPPEQL